MLGFALYDCFSAKRVLPLVILPSEFTVIIQFDVPRAKGPSLFAGCSQVPQEPRSENEASNSLGRVSQIEAHWWIVSSKIVYTGAMQRM